MRYINFSDRVFERAEIKENDGLTRVLVDVTNPPEHQLIRISQHLLEEAGFPLLRVLAAFQWLQSSTEESPEEAWNRIPDEKVRELYERLGLPDQD